MARARILKPDFFRSEEVAALSPLARLLFQGLWTLADRDGRLLDRPRRIATEVLPYDAVDAEALLSEIARNPGLIVRYPAPDGRRCIQVTNFAKHQSPHFREQSLGLPGPMLGNVGQSPGIPRIAKEVHGETGTGPSDPDLDPVSDPVISPPAPARDPLTTHRVAITGPYLTQLFGRIRNEEIGGGFEWSGTPTSPEKAASQAAIVAESGKAMHVEASMRLLFGKAKRGELDEAAKILRSPAFAFGCWCSDFGPLVEEVTGTAPVTPIHAARAGPRRAPDVARGYAAAPPVGTVYPQGKQEL